MKNEYEVRQAFIKAALAGNWTSNAVSIDGPYILYITPDQNVLKSFIKDLVLDIDRTDGLFVDRYTPNTLTVHNLDGNITTITIADAHKRMYGIRSHTGQRPSVLLGTDLTNSDVEKELLFNSFLFALSPKQRIVDLGGAYDSRIN